MWNEQVFEGSKCDKKWLKKNRLRWNLIVSNEKERSIGGKLFHKRTSLQKYEWRERLVGRDWWTSLEKDEDLVLTLKNET